jgi:glycosyltransferase involved in cell wall biosynthesis
MINIILLSTYNGELYIEEQLNSIRNNKCLLPVKIYWYDDGSYDETVRLVQDFQELDIVRIMPSEVPQDIASNFRLLLRRAVELSGPKNLFYYCDQDDIWSIEKLQNAERYLIQDCGLLLTRTKHFGSSTEIITPKIDRYFLLDLFFNISPGMSFAFRPSKPEALISFIHFFKWHDHGTFLYFKYFERKLHVSYLVAQYYRRHSDAVTIKLKRFSISRFLYGFGNLNALIKGYKDAK